MGLSHTHTHTHIHTHTHTPHTHTHHTHTLTHTLTHSLTLSHTLSVLQFFIGMATAQMYQFEYESFSSSLIGSCHNSAVTDIVFPRSVADPPTPQIMSYSHTHSLTPLLPFSDSSELFATSSHGDVRVWHTDTGKELLRLVVPNLSCHALDITPDGGAILTGTLTPGLGPSHTLLSFSSSFSL